MKLIIWDVELHFEKFTSVDGKAYICNATFHKANRITDSYTWTQADSAKPTSTDVDKEYNMYNPLLRMLYFYLRGLHDILEMSSFGEIFCLSWDQNATTPEGSINKTAVI